MPRHSKKVEFAQKDSNRRGRMRSCRIHPRLLSGELEISARPDVRRKPSTSLELPGSEVVVRYGMATVRDVRGKRKPESPEVDRNADIATSACANIADICTASLAQSSGES